jgi:hypothetical protein
MLRQSRTVARPGSFRRRFGKMFVRALLLAVTGAALVFYSGAAAVSAAREPARAPTKLWRAFPLNPTREHLASPPIAIRSALRPPLRQEAVGQSRVAVPATGETRSDASRRNVVLFAVVLLFAVLLLVGAVTLVAGLILASARIRTASTGPGWKAPDEEEPSTYISAVFVGDKRLPIVEGVARRRQGTTTRPRRRRT